MGRVMIALAVLIIFGAAFLLVATPSGPSAPMFLEPPVWSFVVPGAGVVGVIVGLVWMVRIYRGDPEPDQNAWRYRAKR